ncbi:LuxR C-terminal-related transcriptional regulator [Aquimarina sp. M1]
MRNTSYLFIFILSITVHTNGQEIVSGYLTIENPKIWEQKVYLSKVQTDTNNNYTYTQIASSYISEEGYFAFEKRWFSEKDHLYKIYLNPIKHCDNNSTTKHSKLFILSKNDSIHFEKATSPFDTYTTSNTADKEWQQLKKFESKFETLHDHFDTDEYLLRTKGYIKDSLQILLVKLISIKKLDDKKLLEKDIKENTAYYSSLLKELKSSEIDPALFLYLENKISLVYLEKTDKKYSLSVVLNGIAGLVIILLVFLTLRRQRNRQKENSVPLSKQENTIKKLIISGKSNKEIAHELFISINTVKTHISNIYSKLNISNRKELLLKK